MAYAKRGARKGARRLPERLRLKVLKRDRDLNRRCYFDFSDICTGLTGRVEIHHVVDAEDGGTDDEENLISACRPCHRRQSGIDSQKRSVAAANDWKRKPEKHPGVLD